MIPLQQILAKTLKKITPAKQELAKEKKLAQKIAAQIMAMKGSHEKVEIVGSIARNTHLRNDRDLDIFVLYPKELPRKEFEEEGLRIGKAVFKGHKWEKAYSEHPYIRGEINGFRVEVVPSYNIADSSLMQSAVDRSVLHNNYLVKKMEERHKGEARLLKQFMKGIKCYGADLSSNSFPGYVAELLVLKYGSFAKTLEAAAHWKNGEAIDIENYYAEGDAQKKFGWHFTVVDPVDRNRNVVAALSLNQYARFIAASRAFMKKPSINFFFPKKHSAWSQVKLRQFLKKTELVAISLSYPKGVIEDIMWGQLRRFSHKIKTFSGLEGFEVKRSSEWLEKERHMVMLFEVESTELQKAEVKIGPEAFDEKNSEAFLSAHKQMLAGPRIEKGRWVIEVQRKHTELEAFLSQLLKKLRGAEKEAMGKALGKNAKIMSEKEIAALYKKSEGFRQFLTAYLKGKEEFLDY